MKLISFVYENTEQVGVLTGDGLMVRPISGIRTMLELISKWDGHPEVGEPIPLSAVEKCAPIPCPNRDIICLGMNYPKHSAEMERKDQGTYGKNPDRAVYFSKGVRRCTADGDNIERHDGLTQQLDYEAELAVILGREVRDLSPAEVPGAIFGYTVINDVSARDVQQGHKQFYFGKSLDSFAPMGPCILTADEVEFPPRRMVWSRVNGELRQSGVTDQLIFSISDILCQLTKGMTLPAGTIIATGTPEGVGMGFDPPRFLQKGDVVECGVEGIGTITNTVN